MIIGYGGVCFLASYILSMYQVDYIIMSTFDYRVSICGISFICKGTPY